MWHCAFYTQGQRTLHIITEDLPIQLHLLLNILHSPHPLATPIYSTHSPQLSSILINLCKVQSMDDNCGEWVECMGVASGCGEQEVGVLLVGVGGIYGCGTM